MANEKANENLPDPAAMFRDFVTNWERNINNVANQVMGTESFSRLMQEAQKMQLTLQHATSEAMGRRLLDTDGNHPLRSGCARSPRLRSAACRSTPVPRTRASARPSAA